MYENIGDGLAAMFYLLLFVIAALVIALIWALASWKVAMIVAGAVALLAVGVWLGRVTA